MDFHADAPYWQITSDAELAELWTSLMGAGGFSRRSLWLLFLDRDRVTLPVIMPNEDVDARPTSFVLDELFAILGEMRRDGAESFAALLSRPGPDTKSVDDRAWAAELTRASRARGVSMWQVHLATYERVQQLAADDLIGA